MTLSQKLFHSKYAFDTVNKSNPSFYKAVNFYFNDATNFIYAFNSFNEKNASN